MDHSQHPTLLWSRTFICSPSQGSVTLFRSREVPLRATIHIPEINRRVEVKRDMDLIRAILLKIEEDKTLDGAVYKTFGPSDFQGYSQEEITYHVDLLFEADFIFGMPNGNPLPAVSRLKWKGHEFIASIKDEQVWQSVKARLKGIPDVAISIIWEVAKAEIKKRLNLN